MKEEGFTGEHAATLAGGAGVLQLGRYLLERPLGEGAMGVVYAGRDLDSGRLVAVKLMRRGSGGAAGVDRFMREIWALAELRHPGVVEYIEHGLSPEGQPYLVMERLFGEDLQRRLLRGPLTLAEAVALGSRLTDALAAMHARGIVHRDIKPSNIYLPAGASADAKLLDFGVARIGRDRDSLTRTGAVIGTVGYMAPEQARGQGALDGRADLFSLGCVLHECITGEPVFTGEHPLVVLAKIVLDEAPSLRSARPEVPRGLDALVARLLAKDVAARPGSADEVALALAEQARGASSSDLNLAAASGVTLSERRVFCLLLVRHSERTIDPLSATAGADAGPPLDLGPLAAAFGAVFSPVLGGVGLISVELDASPTDAAIQSARCARAILQRLPDATQVLTMGRGERRGRSFIGHVIDRAVALQSLARSGAILLDETTSQLLVGRFTIERTGEVALLGPEREEQVVRMFLGRPGPFVGRARELAWAVGLYQEAVEDTQSCAALITAGPGAGKSRLRHELTRTLTREDPAPLVLVGRGSPMASGAALGLLRGALRDELGVRNGDAAEDQRARWCRRVGERVAPAERGRVSAFLGELAGVYFDAAVHPPLALARRDPHVMAEGMRLAWLDWLRAECQERPVVLFLEDLQWGDAATVNFVAVALHALSKLPFVVMAFARPEVYTMFPGLWTEARTSELRLPRMSERASESLVRAALGESVDEARVRAVVEHADGNPFFLEELIRAAVGPAGGELPETVLGVVEARLHRLDDESRRLLRAASVFSSDFSEAGLHAVLGGSRAKLRARLSALARQEVLTSIEAPDASKYRFRHALVCDAAYSMFTEEDRRLGHRLAAAWLAGQDGREPMAVAEHFRRGGEPERAIEWFHRAAEQALEGGDPNAAVDRAEQAIACGATGPVRAEQRLLQAEARIWAGSLEEALRWAIEAVEGLEPGGRRWYVAIQKVIYCMSVRGDTSAALTWLARAEQATPAPSAIWGPTLCVCEAIYAIHVAGQMEGIDALMTRLDRTVRGDAPPEITAHVSRARAVVFQDQGRFDRTLIATNDAVRDFTAAGDLRNASRIQIWVGHVLGQVGDYSQAEQVLRAGREVAARIGAEQTLIYAQGTLGEVLLRWGRRDEAHEILADALRRSLSRDDPRGEGATRLLLGWAELLAGRPAEAETLCRRGLELIAGQRLFEPLGLAILGSICTAQGRPAEAAALAGQIAALLRRQRGITDHGCFLWLTVAMCFEGSGMIDEAKAGFASGLAHVRALLGRIEDQRLRATVLAMRECQELIERARRLGIAHDDLLEPHGSAV